MPLIVLSQNAPLLEQLGSVSFQRAGLRMQRAATADQLMELCRVVGPRMVLLDTAIADSFALCARIKAEKPAPRVVLLNHARMTADWLERATQVRCDDLVCLPVSDEEMFEHVARAAGMPLRHSHRVAVQLRATLTAGPREFPGWLEDLSPKGARVRVEGPFVGATDLRARFSREDDRTIEARVQVIWQRPVEGGTVVGLAMVELDTANRSALDELCLWEITPRNGGVVVYVQGCFNETTRFEGLLRLLEGRQEIEFDLADVPQFSSAGVRAWSRLLKGLGSSKVRFVRCSTQFTLQAARVTNVMAHGHVVSMCAPYRCEHCDREEVRPLQTAALVTMRDGVTAPPFPCPSCDGELLLEDIPEHYLRLLVETAASD